MQNNIVQLKVLNDNITQYLPQYATHGSAGLDLRACIDNTMEISPQQVILISTGIAVYIQDRNYCGIILPRSGMGHKHGIILGNSVGLIDADYQGELLISLWNRSDEIFTINPLDRVAQLIIIPVTRISLEVVNEFTSDTIRKDNGFGSTGCQ